MVTDPDRYSVWTDMQVMAIGIGIVKEKVVSAHTQKNNETASLKWKFSNKSWTTLRMRNKGIIYLSPAF